MQIEKGYPPLALLLYLQSAPPDVIFSAFRQDCASKGVPWYSSESQNYVLEYCLRHPVSKKYPPRYSTLRSFLKQYITSLEDPDVMSAHASNDVDGEEDPVHLELMESYIGLSVMNAGVNDDWCYKSFFNPYIERLRTTRRTEHKYLNMDGGVEDASGDKEERREQRRREKKEILSMFCPVRVSCQQLSNVGYSLWPASFVMTQLLAQELVGTTRLLAPYLFPHRKLWGEAEANEPPLDMSERLNIVELGSGVGLTPALLHRVPAYCRHVGTYTITDYQNGILENINYNLDENKVCRVEDYVAASRGLQSDVEPPFHMTAIVDWTRLATARSVITSCPMNLLLAADCIYDVDVIPGLVATMRVFMQESFPAMVSKSNRMTLGSTKQENDLQKRTCLVVQTHRQNSTMKVFFDAVREFAVVRSYLLVRRRIGEMRRRLSSGKDGRDRGLIPLGEWAATIDQGPTVFEDEERIVCALQPDEVLPDGSLRSLRGVRNVADTTGSTSHRGGSSTPGTGSINSYSYKKTSQGSGNTFNTSSMGTLQAVDIEQLLKDDMIGPFYTSMAGLVAVHVLRLRGADDDEDDLGMSLRPPRPPGSRRSSHSSPRIEVQPLVSTEVGSEESTLPRLSSSNSRGILSHSKRKKK